MSYSSGPWVVSSSLDPTVCFSIKSDGALVAQVVKTGAPIRPGDGIGNSYWILDNDLENVTTLANANLVSAAPELLEALQFALERLKIVEKESDYDHRTFHQGIAIDKAIAAINKATGEQK